MKYRLILSITILLFFGIWATSCKTSRRSEKYYEKQQKKDDAAAQKAYDKKLKEFENIQSANTRKMMKDMDKQSKQLNKSRKH